MMRGRKWELFKLYVSFLGWELLGVLLTLLAYLPFLLVAGCIAGAFTGGCAQLILLQESRKRKKRDA